MALMCLDCLATIADERLKYHHHTWTGRWRNQRRFSCHGKLVKIPDWLTEVLNIIEFDGLWETEEHLIAEG